ncbi:hypothetical protein IV102_12805 [bacterium]|nr:hypothetical protein [bacterium]
MISIAIFSIFLAIGLGGASLHWLHRESDYRFALRNARYQVAAVRTARFDSLPPQTLTVGAGGWVQLAHKDLVPESLQVLGAEIPVQQVDNAKGRALLTAAAGTRVCLSYSYYLPDRGEAHTVPTSAPYQIVLRNTPVLYVDQVRVADGKVVPASGYQVVGEKLELTAKVAGKVVEIDYAGARIRNQVGGSYLDAGLNSTLQPGPCKLMRIQESYGFQGMGRIDLNLVKVADKL